MQRHCINYCAQICNQILQTHNAELFFSPHHLPDSDPKWQGEVGSEVGPKLAGRRGGSRADLKWWWGGGGEGLDPKWQGRGGREGVGLDLKQQEGGGCRVGLDLEGRGWSRVG